jgi:hypothetical protein
MAEKPESSRRSLPPKSSASIDRPAWTSEPAAALYLNSSYDGDLIREDVRLFTMGRRRP